LELKRKEEEGRSSKAKMRGKEEQQQNSSSSSSSSRSLVALGVYGGWASGLGLCGVRDLVANSWDKLGLVLV
jgi:hypothetical protein